MIDLTQDYSRETLALADTAKVAILAKAKELGIPSEDTVNAYMLTTMKIYTRSLAAAYVAAHNRENVDDMLFVFMTATAQRIKAEIEDIRSKKDRNN